MDDQTLDAIRQRVEAATEGPWRREGDSFVSTATIDQWGHEVSYLVEVCGGFGPADADFIAHARADVPALLAEVESLRTERDAWERKAKVREDQVGVWKTLLYRRIGTLEDRVVRLTEALTRIRKCVGAQAEDEGLWFIAATAAEAYLQQELRALHDTVERVALGAGVPTENTGEET